MTDDTRRTALSKLDAIAAARHWLSLGIQPVPLKPKSKRPKLKGWTKFLASAETIEDHFKAGDNIGGLWGEASNGIVDIDLDTLESATIAGVMLPSTFVYGHEDRERTHYLYVCLDATTQKWHDLSGNVILELRSTGSQSVLPPSIHPDGDRYITHDERRFTHISQESLIESLNRVAALSVLAGVYPSGHGRHDFIHSITGALLHSGWNAVDVRTSVIALLAAVSARETDMDQRVRTIDNTIDHFKKGSRVAGWPTLAGMVKADVLELVRRWLSVTEVDEIIPARRPTRRDYVRPVELLETIPAGLVREVAAWAAKYSYAVQPVLSVAVGLMCTALATRNRFVVSGWSTPLQPYMMMLAPTGGGKESALKSVRTFCERLGISDNHASGFQSWHALRDRLGIDPVLCWLWDEAGRKFKSSGKPSSPDYGLITELLSAYGQGNSVMAGIPGRRNPIDPVMRPYLCVMATSQPALLMEAVTSADLASGIINRFIMFDIGDEVPPLNELPRNVVFPASMEAMARVMVNRRRIPDDEPLIEINFTAEGYRLFKEFATDAHDKLRVEGLADIWSRANQNALIVAGILAASGGGDRPVIDEEIASWSIAWIRWTLGRWEQRIARGVVRSRVEGDCKTIERVIRGMKKYTGGVRPAQAALMASGKIPKSVLTKACCHISMRDREDAIKTLLEADVIGAGKVDGITVYWLKMSA